jgi:hypothetical protein
VVEAADLAGVGGLDRVARALHVGSLRRLLVGFDVVHRREVEEVVDRDVGRQSRVVDAEAPERQVSGDRHYAALLGVQPLRQRLHLAMRALACQDVDRAFAPQELLD